MGWAGVFVFNFAWFANLFLPITVLATLLRGEGKLGIVCAAIGLTLAATASFFYFIPRTMPEVSTPYVIGYGWGYVLWSLSFILMLLAAIIEKVSSNKEQAIKQIINSDTPTQSRQSLRIYHIFYLFDMALLGLCISISDKSLESYQRIQTTAAVYQRQELRDAVIPLEAICTIEIAQISQPLTAYTHIVEYSGTKGKETALRHVKALLTAGAKAVQYNSIEYYLSEDGRLAEREPFYPADILIDYSKKAVETKSHAQLTITDVAHQRILLNQQWQEQPRINGKGRFSRMCPYLTIRHIETGETIYYPEQFFIDLFEKSE